ncbi:penicillin-insensitive murein endopeptidase [Salmonella enterica subsp. enterica]|nr:penicillin-insensitive murein endopeptidase [Salmonella enterica subsp. enterica]
MARCWHGSVAPATPWQKNNSVPGAAQSIGSFSSGDCIIGADTLPVRSDNYQVMRTDQRRYFGHRIWSCLMVCQ